MKKIHMRALHIEKAPKTGGTIPHLAPGWCVIRIVRPDKSAGGIILTTTAQNKKAQAYLVATTERFVADGGALIEIAAPVGALVHLRDVPELYDYETLPEDHRVMHLSNIHAWEPLPKPVTN